jgi:murein DD-endopeptidase MepM/ murein hydrolase activator NlpD
MKIAESIFRTTSYTQPLGRSLYGWRINPVTNKPQFHEGTDYSTQGRKLPLYVVEDGIVVDVGYNSVRGNYVDIRYPRIDLVAIHRHLDSFSVRVGESVKKGHIFGITGTTGSSTGVHLHLGLKRISTNSYIDPEKFDYQEHYINGIWNEQFTRDLQKYCGTFIDGVISGQNGTRANIKKVNYGLRGSQMVRVLQKRLGISINGQLDKPTIRALQKALGLKQDGFISPISNTVRTMQERLSEGWLL